MTTPVSAIRVSDQLMRSQLSTQLETHRSALLDLQTQISTGRRISRPSDDAPAALRAIELQRLLEQKEQVKSNLSISRSFVAATDSTLANVADRVIDLRGQALAIADSGATDSQRDLFVQDIQAAIRDLVNIGNREFRGRFLFAGSTTGVKPFEIVDDNVVYNGNDASVSSYVDTDFLSPTNLNGNAVFGTISAAVEGSSDLNPVLRPTTRLSSLNGGLGVTRGSFLISDGASIQSIDISSAETVGDVVKLIEASPPAGRSVTVQLGSDGFIVDLDDAGGGSLTILDSEGRTATELGIQNSHGAGVQPLIGTDINPRLDRTSLLADILGTRASALLDSSAASSDILVESSINGSEFNDVEVRFVEMSAVGDEAIASYDELAKELVIDISQGATTANSVVSAINATGAFTAKLDTLREPSNDGSGFVELASVATTSGGAGNQFDQDSGIQVNNGGAIHTITFEDADTIEDLLNLLNHSSANLVADLNSTGTGIDVRSRLGGTDFQIGENGGTTASELGIRSFALDSRLDSLNYGRGIDTATGTDFVIRRKDGLELEIDVSSAQTVGDVVSLINDHADNTGAAVSARLATFGNGIELFDSNAAGPETLTVTRSLSFASWGLGLVDSGSDSQAAESAGTAAATITFAPSSPPNTALNLTASQPGYALDGVEIVLADTRTGDVADASYDSVAKQLTINIDATTTTANTILGAVNLEATFSAALETTSDPTNDGSGIVGVSGLVGTSAGGSDERVLGRDVRPAETHGIFNSLIRLRNAVSDFDLVEIGRATELLDEDFERLNFARADLGSRGQLFDAIDRRIEDEEVETRSALSLEIDTDMAKAISDLNSRQASFQATLQLIGRVIQLSVLDFI